MTAGFHRLRLTWLVLIGLLLATTGSLATISGYHVENGSLIAAKTTAGAADDAFTRGMKYADWVRARGVQDPVSHNFPYSFDDAILATKPIPKNNGYNIFQQPGTMNGKNGVFEIGSPRTE
jgi:hypothetical protein